MNANGQVCHWVCNLPLCTIRAVLLHVLPRFLGILLGHDALCGVFSYRISVLILWQLFVIGRHSPSMIWGLCPFSRNVLVLRVVGLVALDVALSAMCEGVVRVAELVFPAPLVYIVLVFRICNSVLILAPLLFLAYPWMVGIGLWAEYGFLCDRCAPSTSSTPDMARSCRAEVYAEVRYGLGCGGRLEGNRVIGQLFMLRIVVQRVVSGSSLIIGS